MTQATNDERQRLHAALRTVAVTGTNGKTTTTSMLATIAAAAGEVPASVTTLGMRVGGRQMADDKTFDSFLRTAAEAVRTGARPFAIEVTSRALASGFAKKWPAEIAVLTNLSRDHLDRHGTPEAYLAAKAQLFLALPPGGAAILNGNDPASALVAELLDPSIRRLFFRGPLATGRRDDGAPLGGVNDLVANEVTVSRQGTRLSLAHGDLARALDHRLDLRVIGHVHAENALAAALAAHALGIAPGAIAAGLASFAGVDGRFQIVAEHPLVVVDFAHTPDALRAVLRTCRSIAGPGEVICVFGCGGDRDTGKRAPMGAVADDLADRIFVTNDNPRSEDPMAIAAAICANMARSQSRTVQLDRGTAIAEAIASAGPADVVLIAGRGHEREQIVGAAAIPFSDAEAAAEACRNAGFATLDPA